MKILRLVSIILFISFLIISCGSGGGDGDDSGNNNGGGGSFVATLDMTQDDNGMAEVTVFDETFERGNGKPVTENRTFIGIEGTATIKLMNDRISSAIVTVNGQVIFDASDFNQNVSSLEKEIMLLDGLNILDVLLRSKPGGKLSVQIIMEDTCVPGNPAIEVCDGLDNDCNGQIDDGIGDTPITCGIGECESSGVKQCINGGTVDTCEPGNPSKEVCDGLDNDCDGLTDETGDALCDNEKYCDGQETCVGVGGCQSGSLPCPVGTTCNESSDTCPVVDCTDKDKDGYSVEGGSCGPVDCDDNIHNIYPGATEVCDGKDNDCDGSTDEIFTDLGDSCSDGKGECKATGTIICNSNGTGTTCNATAGSPKSEVCDGKDNDCDGVPDGSENLTRTCGVSDVGECSYGTENCNNAGSWVNCNAIYPVDEVPGTPTCSDNKDNDCDGLTDYDDTVDCQVNIVGTWDIIADWDCDGETAVGGWEINPDGTFTDFNCAVCGDLGTWTLNNNNVILIYDQGTEYTGTVTGNHMEGTMLDVGGGASGCWRADKVF